MAQTRRPNLPFGQKVTPSDPRVGCLLRFRSLGGVACWGVEGLGGSRSGGQTSHDSTHIISMYTGPVKGPRIRYPFSSCNLSFSTNYSLDPPGGTSKQKKLLHTL